MISMVQNKKEIQSACDQAKDEVYKLPITIDHLNLLKAKN